MVQLLSFICKAAFWCRFFALAGFSKIPTWLSTFVPTKYMYIEEEAWNAYPKCKTGYFLWLPDPLSKVHYPSSTSYQHSLTLALVGHEPSFSSQETCWTRSLLHRKWLHSNFLRHLELHTCCIIGTNADLTKCWTITYFQSSMQSLKPLRDNFLREMGEGGTDCVSKNWIEVDMWCGKSFYAWPRSIRISVLKVRHSPLWNMFTMKRTVDGMASEFLVMELCMNESLEQLRIVRGWLTWMLCVQCPYLNRFKLTIETVHVADNGNSPNVRHACSHALVFLVCPFHQFCWRAIKLVLSCSATGYPVGRLWQVVFVRIAGCVGSISLCIWERALQWTMCIMVFFWVRSLIAIVLIHRYTIWIRRLSLQGRWRMWTLRRMWGTTGATS